jgi:hypothetical protein
MFINNFTESNNHLNYTIMQISIPEFHQIDIKPTILNTDVPISDFDNNTLPIAPLVSAKYSNSEKTKILLRVVVFISSDFKDKPIFGIGTDKNFYVFYNLNENLPVTSYTTWYFKAEYETNGMLLEKDSVTMYNFNTDPKTSRGTVTSVGSSTGDFL